MRKPLFILTLVLASVSFLYSQETFRPQVMTSATSAVRHEVIQASGSGVANVTLRLDKFTGRVFWLSNCPQRIIIGLVPCWKETTVLELPKPSNDSTAKFQIFVQAGENGISRSILMMNNVSGQTWQFGIEDGIYKWTPFTDTITLPQSYEIVR
ncbi:MAG: hypothetical protein QM785_10705 [Pyrinomonadaceae bacterium]